jgi:hypothetical protein
MDPTVRGKVEARHSQEPANANPSPDGNTIQSRWDCCMPQAGDDHTAATSYCGVSLTNCAIGNAVAAMFALTIGTGFIAGGLAGSASGIAPLIVGGVLVAAAWPCVYTSVTICRQEDRERPAPQPSIQTV